MTENNRSSSEKVVLYNSDFYENNVVWGSTSAKILVPLIVNLFNPHSVVDFGCGTGAWLREYVKNGVSDIRGYDGDYVLDNKLLIDERFFFPCNLEDELNIDRKFDLAMSLEVAEHLPEVSADSFVNKLTLASSLIVFSAAVPGQGGIGHVNEQWTRYWSNKFIKQGYTPIDILRKKIIGLTQIRPYYRSNIMIYTNREDVINKYSDFITNIPDEYMLSDGVDWMRKGYEKRIANLNMKLSIINDIVDLFNTEKLELWLRRKKISKIAIWGMGEIGLILANLLSRNHIVVMFDLYKEEYLKYDEYDDKETIDLIIIALVENAHEVKKRINQDFKGIICGVEEFIYDIKKN